MSSRSNDCAATVPRIHYCLHSSLALHCNRFHREHALLGQLLARLLDKLDQNMTVELERLRLAR